MCDLSNHLILAIDDEDDNLLVLESTLALLHQAIVKVAHSAEEAFDVLDNFHPTAIVADIAMPKMDGFELLKALRQRTDTRDLPIIAVTAHAMVGDRERVLAAGFDGYISKPFEVMAIGDQIHSLIASHQARQVAALTENKLVTPPGPAPVEWSKVPHEAQ